MVLKIRPTSVKVDLACKANGYGQMSSINRLEGDERLLCPTDGGSPFVHMYPTRYEKLDCFPVAEKLRFTSMQNNGE